MKMNLSVLIISPTRQPIKIVRGSLVHVDHFLELKIKGSKNMRGYI